jgi:toxin ParE1/3/4
VPKGYDLAPRARQQLLDIFDWTADRFGELQAESYLMEMRSAFNRIAANPHLGAAYRGRTRRFVFGQHLIYYRIQQTGILIARVDHGRQRRY